MDRNECVATKTEEVQEYFPAVETHLIHSRHVQQTFQVKVMRPSRLKGAKVRYPVVYATDGNFAFDALKGISYSIQRYARDAPSFILVGIGYPSESPLAGQVLRARDMTFQGYPQFSTKPLPVEGILVADKQARDYYGAEDFQRFIENELVPVIDEKYETIPGERTYFGHSLGGSFGLFTLFTKPHLFKRYIISTPALMYHGESSAGMHYENNDFLLRNARNFIHSRPSLDGVRIYMSVGAEEEFESTITEFQFTSSLYRLAALLRAAAIPGLELTTEVFPGETHLTVWPIAFIHGIQATFGTRTWRRN
jgi:uncharacterized protein